MEGIKDGINVGETEGHDDMEGIKDCRHVGVLEGIAVARQVPTQLLPVH